MQKNLVLERSQKQYLIKSASGKDGNAGIALGVMFLALSLLCRHGAEHAGGSRGETPAR